MNKQEKWNIIINLCQQNNGITSVQQIIDTLNISSATVRRILQEMEDLHLIIRTHGGAKLIDNYQNEPSMAIKTTQNIDIKRRIGLLAASLIQDNQMIYIDAGSTTEEMIPYIKANNVTIVTNGIPHIIELNKKNINTIVLGGQVYQTTLAIVGRTALKQLEDTYFDIAFVGTNGIHAQFGFSTSNELEAEIKSLAIKHADKSYILADHTKFNQLRPAQFANITDATIITDSIENFNNNNIKYLLIKK